MIKHYILKDKKLVEVDLMTWAKFFEEDDRIVGNFKFNQVMVSTVFLGIDHSFGQGPPLLFETMIFGGKHDQYMDRYSTYKEAERGHKKAIALVKGQSLSTRIYNFITSFKKLFV